MSVNDVAMKYHAIKMHFNVDKYDAIKYQFKIPNRIIPNNQYSCFQILEKRYGKNIIDFYVPNFLENPKVWVKDLLSEESNDIYIKWLKKKQTLTYVYKNDLINLVEEYDDLNDIFIIKDSYPVLMKRVLQSKTNIETLLLLNSVLKFFNRWNSKLSGDIIWEPFFFKCKKYYRFLDFDKDRVKNILISEIGRYK